MAPTAVREEPNKALAAIQSVNSGSGSPSPATAYQYFIDESATPALIKQRNAANDGDILLGEVDGQAYFSNGTQSKPSISFRDDTDQSGLRRNAADKLSIVTNGADRVTVDSSGNLGIKTTSPAADLHIQNTGNAVAQLTAGLATYAQFVSAILTTQTSAKLNITTAATFLLLIQTPLPS